MRTTALNTNFTNKLIINQLGINPSTNKADVYEHEVRIQEFKFAQRNVSGNFKRQPEKLKTSNDNKPKNSNSIFV